MAYIYETYKTEKTCKCGQHLVIEYQEVFRNGSPVERGVQVVGNCGYFKARNWPNWVYCAQCHRKHAMEKFSPVGCKDVDTEVIW